MRIPYAKTRIAIYLNKRSGLIRGKVKLVLYVSVHKSADSAYGRKSLVNYCVYRGNYGHFNRILSGKLNGSAKGYALTADIQGITFTEDHKAENDGQDE